MRFGDWGFGILDLGVGISGLEASMNVSGGVGERAERHRKPSEGIGRHRKVSEGVGTLSDSTLGCRDPLGLHFAVLEHIRVPFCFSDAFQICVPGQTFLSECTLHLLGGFRAGLELFENGRTAFSDVGQNIGTIIKK